MTEHSIYGASVAHRYLKCNVAPMMSKPFPNTTNDAAELGTAAHSLSEFCFKMNVDAYECKGITFNKKFVVDDEMIEAVQLYVSHVRMICKQLGVSPLIEVKVYINSIAPNVFGTSDCVIIAGDLLIVIDYKNGFRLVEIKDNPQAIFYALAVLDTFGLWQRIKKIKTAIVQPRADHIDGAIRYHEYETHELIAWHTRFKQAILNPNPQQVAGDHCKYCLASPVCKARIMRTINLAYIDKPMGQISDAQLEIMFNEVSTIKNNADMIAQYMNQLAKSGRQFRGYKLVKARKVAICKDEVGLIAKAKEKNINPDDLYTKKIISKTKAEKLIGKNEAGEFYEIPPASSVLAPITDSRPAISHSAIGVFNEV